MIHITKQCFSCNKLVSFEVSEEGYDKYIKGAHVQNAFPNLSAELREMFLSGICPTCWDEMFKDIDDE